MISSLGSSIFLECAPDDGSDALVLSLDKTQFGVPCKINADKKKEVLEDYVAQSRVIASYGLLDVSSSVVVVVPTTIQATYSNCLLSVTIPKGKVYGSTVLNSKLGTITLKYTPEGKSVQSKSIDLYVRPDTSHEVIKADFGEEISKFNQDVIDLSDALEEKADANDIPVLASDGKTIVFGDNQRLTTVTNAQFEVLQGEFETAEEAMAGSANENDKRITNYSTELRQTSREISLSAQAVQSNYENTAKALADAVTAKNAAVQAKADAESAKGSVTDMYSEISVTAEGITQTAASVTEKAGEVQGKYTQIQQTAESITSTAASVTEIAGQVNEKYTQIQQTASGITLTASQVSSDAASAGQAKNAAEDALSNVQTIKNNIDTAKTAVEDAKKAVEDVETTINGVKTTIDGIKGEIDTAKGAVETAQQGAEDAKALAESARDAAQTAQGLAETAKANAVSAQTAAETAQGLAETAKAEAITAKGGAETARDSAVSAKNDASGYRDEALGYKNDAKDFSDQAEASASSASDSASNAATSESNASASADSASTSASNAATSESNAHQYALDSESYYSQIGLDAQGMTGVFASVKTYTDTKAQEASNSASAAAGSASSAEGSANSASDSASSASTSATNAESSANDAAGSASSASASATRIETAISSFNANAEEIVGSVTKQIEENEEALAGAANDMSYHVETYNTEIKQTAEEIRLSAVKIEAEKVSYSEFKQRAESIEASVSEIDDNKVDYSEFNQRANAIQLSVTNLDKRVGDIIAGEGSSEVYVTQTEFELLSDKVSYVVTGTAGGYSVNGSVILGLMFDDNGQMKSQYSVSADNITNLASYISNTVTNGTVSASIVQAINNGSSEVKISADHIVLDGEAVANSIKTETVELGDGSSKFFANGTGYLGHGGFVYNNEALYIRPMKTSGQSDTDTMNVATTRGIKFNPDQGIDIVNHSGGTTGNQYDVLYIKTGEIRGRVEQRQGVGDGASQSIKDKFILNENTLAFHDWAEIYLGNGSTIYIGEEYISVDEDGDVSISEGIIDAIRDAL